MASNEATLERMLQKVIDLWMASDFRLVPHVSGTVSIIAGADDILAQLEESQVTIGTIRGSRYVTPIKVISLILFMVLVFKPKHLGSYKKLNRSCSERTGL